MGQVIFACWFDRSGLVLIATVFLLIFLPLIPKYSKLSWREAASTLAFFLCIHLYNAVPYIKDAYYQDIVSDEVEMMDVLSIRDSAKRYAVNGSNGEFRLRISTPFKEYELEEGKFYRIEYLKHSRELIFSEEIGALD